MASALPRHLSSSEKEEWLVNIRDCLKETKKEESKGIGVSVFNVPKLMKSTKPEAYNPQLIALGPYHHWNPELYELEQYKISAAKRCQRKLKTSELEDAVECFKELEHEIRAHYHRYLDLDETILAWMMAIDVSFFLEFLQIYEDAEGKGFNRLVSRMSLLVDNAGRKSTHNTIIRDIMMLENQIPLFLPRKFLQLQCSSLEAADQKLSSTLKCFMKEISPFEMKNFPTIDVAEHDHTHLLGLLYRILVRNSEAHYRTNADTDEIKHEEDADTGRSKDTDDIQKCYTAFLGFLPSLKICPKPIKAIASILPRAFSHLPKSSSGTQDQPILSAREIAIPSVTELISVGLTFKSTNGGLDAISFDKHKLTMYLPTVKLDANTEDILRNLVAYEVSVASGPPIFTRYVELMNGIIDTEEDARQLQRKGIIISGMKTSSKIADIWNGMTTSVRLTSVPQLDHVIREVNGYYNSRWKVKARKFVKVHVLDSWKFLTFVAAVMMLLMTGVQSFCSVYSCSRWFKYSG